jgi:hypothetical protein
MIPKKENDVELILKVAECSGMECFSWLRARSSGEDGTETWGLKKAGISPKIERCLKEIFYF